MRWMLLALLLALAPGVVRAQRIDLGSKKFTESVILAEMARHLLEAEGFAVAHRAELGGTQFLWQALLAGDIDAYPDYTGTILEEILAGRTVTADALPEALAAFGIRTTAPLGFNNTYALGLRADRPDLRFGFSNEFMDRGDGWPALRAAYDLPQRAVRGLDHDLAYRGLESGTIDLTDLYSTDAEIEHYDIRTLEDDLGHFPEYQAVILYREDLPPQAAAVLERLAGTISADQMARLNGRALLERIPEAIVAADFVDATFGVQATVEQEGFWARLGRNTRAHLALVVALFLYSLLPIVRNTHAGLQDVAPALRESAAALGLPAWAQLRKIELPLAARSILAGIQTSAVINVGTATLGAIIGAGGYGQPILTGIRLDDTGLILEGAVPAALLALVVQGLFEVAERVFVSKGLRVENG